MAEQRTRGQAGQLREEGRRHRRLRLPRPARRGRARRPSPATREVSRRGHRAGPARRRRRRSRRPAPAPRSSWSSTAPRSTPRPAARSPTPASSGSPSGALVEVVDVQKPVPGLIVHRGVVREGEVTVGDQALGRGRRLAPAVDLARPHRDPPAAPGAAQGARRDGDPGRLVQRARPAALRLRLAHGRAGRPSSATSRTRSTPS